MIDEPGRSILCRDATFLEQVPMTLKLNHHHLNADIREHYLSGATTTPRNAARSIAALTRPSDFALSTNLRT